ncbi:MAG: glycosyltransferase [Chitinophagales bacterium]|nr:glycosyltransferase [Chitinophagales bacterium]
MKKKIVLTVTNDLSYDQRMQRICRSLSNAGYEVELAGRVLQNSASLKEEPYRQKRVRCIFNKGKLFYAEYNLRLFFYLLFQNFDAVCAVDLDTIASAFIAGKLKHAKLVYDAHEFFTEVPEVIRRSAVKRIWQWVERQFAPKADLAYTVSGSLAELFQQRLSKPFQVIRNLPYKQIDDNTEANRQSYLLYQGALNEGRGLENLLTAMQQLNCKLKIAGEGDLSEQLRAMAKTLDVENKVEFLGYLPPDKLKEVTRKAAIGINLLERTGDSYYYSLANKFFDYVQAMVPQVCIDFPEYRKVNEQHQVAVLTKSTSPHEIKNAVERLLNDNSLYSQLQKNCRACAGELNWENEEKKLLLLYEQLFR